MTERRPALGPSEQGGRYADPAVVGVGARSQNGDDRDQQITERGHFRGEEREHDDDDVEARGSASSLARSR
jgi:hypothetical protein